MCVYAVSKKVANYTPGWGAARSGSGHPCREGGQLDAWTTRCPASVLSFLIVLASKIVVVISSGAAMGRSPAPGTRAECA